MTLPVPGPARVTLRAGPCRGVLRMAATQTKESPQVLRTAAASVAPRVRALLASRVLVSQAAPSLPVKASALGVRRVAFRPA
jgi:hypothetical protein